MKSLSPALLLGPALLCGAAWLLTGCAGPGYYAQAVSGHLDLMQARRDVAAVLADQGTGEELRQSLQAAAEIRAFAVTRLGLPDNGSFTEYAHTGREAVTWNVVAAPEFSLEPRHWCFPLAGCVPYRGYFDPLDAERLAARLAGKGNDVAVSPALAYSTLGWFRDPLLDTMFRYSEEQLAGIVFHELAHQKLYVKGDAAFNESYATFIEEIGVMLWLDSSGKPFKNNITDVMSLRVIYLFKIIQIKKTDAKADIATVCYRFLLVQYQHHMPSVGQSGKLIGDGHPFHFFHGLGQIRVFLAQLAPHKTDFIAHQGKSDNDEHEHHRNNNFVLKGN